MEKIPTVVDGRKWLTMYGMTRRTLEEIDAILRVETLEPEAFPSERLIRLQLMCGV